MRTTLDHLVVVAPTLAAGVEFVHRELGVAPQPGGEHPTMGTHNYVLRLGERIYLEVIAVNPKAPRPPHRRWFELDTTPPETPPRLATWVARTDAIEDGSASPVPLGKVMRMSRGELNWRITIRDDGTMPLQGVAPSLIQWPAGVHPADGMPDLGCEFVRLQLFHSDTAALAGVLDAIGFAGGHAICSLSVGIEPHLIAHIQTPKGMHQLRC
jgi:hypothetical protein